MDVFTPQEEFRVASRKVNEQVQLIFVSKDVPAIGGIIHGQRLLYTRVAGKWKSVPLNSQSTRWFVLSEEAHQSVDMMRTPKEGQVIKTSPTGAPLLLWKDPVMVELIDEGRASIGVLGESSKVSGTQGVFELQVKGVSPGLTYDEVFNQATKAWNRRFQL